MNYLRQTFALALLLALPAPIFAQDTPGTVKFPSAQDSQDSLIRATNTAKTTLSASLSAGATTIAVVSTASFPSSGTAVVDNEIFFYSGKTGSAFTGVVRAADSSTAVTHSSGASVRGIIAAAHHNTLVQAIIEVEEKLGSGISAPEPNAVLVGGTEGASSWQTQPAIDCSNCTGVDANKLRGRNVTNTAPANGQVLGYNATTGQWEPQSAGATVSGGNATQLQGRTVSATAPTTGQGLVYNSSSGAWEPGTIATGGAQVINPRDAPYNAKCDFDWATGTGTNDTSAISLALNAMLLTGKPLYLPGLCLVSGTSGQVFTLNKAKFHIYGDGYWVSGLVMTSTTPNTVDFIHISPPATGGQPTGAWAHQANGRDNRNVYIHDVGFFAQSEPSMYTQPYPAQPGRHALYFDTRAAGQFIEGVTIERNWFGSFSGKAMYFDNSNGSTYANLDGQYQMVIANNVIRNGIVGNWWGDSLRITNNRFIGEGAAVDSKQVTGATTLNFLDNNCTSRGGCGTFHNGYTINYLRNIVELGFAGSVGVNGALVDFRGDLDPIQGFTVGDNIFNSIGSGSTLDGVSVDHAIAPRFLPNDFNSAASGTHYRVRTTPNTINPFFSRLNLNQSGTAALTNTTGGSASPLYEVATINGEPNITNPDTFTPNFMGVERAYTKSFALRNGTTPLTPVGGAGLEMWYDADGRISGGIYDPAGGAGFASLLAYDRDAAALRDMQIGGNKGLLNFPGGLSVNTTVIAPGVTGAATINTMSGRVNFAASAAALVVTNSLVTTNSIVLCTIQTNDSTLKSVQCVPAGGSFTMFGNAAATAETRVAFWVLNQ